MSDALTGIETMDIHIEGVRDYVTLATLADQETPREGMNLLRAIVKHKLAVKWDISDPNDIEVEAWDIERDGMLYWQTEMWWRVYCDQCEQTAIHQTDMSGNACQHHYDEAWKQEQADLDNDDRAIGMQP